MAKYQVRMDMTVVVTVEVEAENEEQAESEAVAKTFTEESYYLSNYESVYKREVIDVNECESEEKSEIDKAIDYVKENMDEDDMAILKAEINKSYNMHLIPTENTVNCSKVIDLLEEYGQENDLPEGWWESECEISEILVKL